MNGEAPKKKKTWIWVVLGILVFLGFVAIGGVIVAVSFFRENLAVTHDIGEKTAMGEFDAVYAKFPGQVPLIQMRDGRPQLVAERAAQTGNGQSLTTMHVIAFDQDDDELAKFSLPFWLLRMKSGPIRLSAYSQGWDDRGVSFDIKDLEAHGPGIVLDVPRPSEGRVLIWVE